MAVLRRGPTDWFSIGRWDLEQPAFESGAWFRGTLYPQKCDLSPDGRWLAYSAHKLPSSWPAGSIYEAISRLPWLTALVAWEAGTTYTRGFHFDDVAGQSDLGTPDFGDAGPCLARFGLRLNPPIQFAVERRRGWSEAPGTPSRESGGPWDEQRRIEMRKHQPNGRLMLHVEGSFAGFRTSPGWHEPAAYYLSDGIDLTPLNGVQWADWDSQGRLLVATAQGALEIRTLDGTDQTVVFKEDLSGLAPDPSPPPEWAAHW